ncbi:MAG: T9SS type A sorting domain-containing protein [Bacteroidota bacterium]|nr:T9SS type A sorting domain-containing protein [Bacteroidota bacterium]
MKRNSTLALLVIVNCVVSLFTFSQNPIYVNEKLVTINGFTIDAMEPQLSTDGNALFFNSLNDGITTSLFYAARVNDTTFNYIGAMPVVNQTATPRLDAVASIDTADNFYWVSNRGWPTITENLHRIRFLTVGYTNFGRVYGDFYIPSPGWIIMDAGVSYYGDKIIYCNALFNSCTNNMPCKAAMGIAQKINDSTFNKMANTSTIFANVNDTVNYIVYAPNLTEDGLELFYSRLLHNGTQTEVMLATRSNTNSAFGFPSLLVGAPSLLPEAPTVSTNKSKMYYHKKTGPIFKLFVRYRQLSVDIKENKIENKYSIYPNPTNDFIHISGIKNGQMIQIQNTLGEMVVQTQTSDKIDISALNKGLYFIILKENNSQHTFKIIKN